MMFPNIGECLAAFTIHYCTAFTIHYWTLKFYDLLEQFSFTQLVNTPTHIQGHILDALCVRDSFSWAISPIKLLEEYQTTRQSCLALFAPSESPVMFNIFPSVKFTR